MTAPARFTQSDLTRAFRAAKAADVSVRIEIEPTGKIVIVSGSDVSVAAENPCDRVLKR